MSFFQKQQVVKPVKEKGNQPVNLNGILMVVHKFGFIAACALYCLSTIFALPCFRAQNQSYLLAKQLLFNFSILLAISQSCQFAAKIPTVSKFQIITFLVTLSASIFFAVTTVFQETYNQGARYMISSFLLSVSNEFKIIKLLLPKNRIRQERNRFLSEITCCFSSIIFFFVAVLKETSQQNGYIGTLCPIMNLLSGALMSFSIVYIYKSKQDKGSEGYEGLANMYQPE